MYVVNSDIIHINIYKREIFNASLYEIYHANFMPAKFYGNVTDITIYEVTLFY